MSYIYHRAGGLFSQGWFSRDYEACSWSLFESIESIHLETNVPHNIEELNTTTLGEGWLNLPDLGTSVGRKIHMTMISGWTITTT